MVINWSAGIVICNSNKLVSWDSDIHHLPSHLHRNMPSYNTQSSIDTRHPIIHHPQPMHAILYPPLRIEATIYLTLNRYTPSYHSPPSTDTCHLIIHRPQPIHAILYPPLPIHATIYLTLYRYTPSYNSPPSIVTRHLISHPPPIHAIL